VWSEVLILSPPPLNKKRPPFWAAVSFCELTPSRVGSLFATFGDESRFLGHV
jgi:hypothetical protein